MMSFVVLLLFFFIQWTFSGKVSYLVTIETLKVRVVIHLIVSSFPFEPIGRSGLLVSFLLEVSLTYSSFGMGRMGLIILFK